MAVLREAMLTGQHFRGHVGRRLDDRLATQFAQDDPADAVEVFLAAHAGEA